MSNDSKTVERAPNGLPTHQIGNPDYYQGQTVTRWDPSTQRFEKTLVEKPKSDD